MKTHKEIINQIIADLENNDQIKVTRKDIRLNHEEVDDINLFFKEHGLSICDNLLSFYNQLQLVHISWEVIENNNLKLLQSNRFLITGEINILPYHIMLEGIDNNRWQGILWFDNDESGSKKALKKLKPFDYFYKDDSGCVCAQIKSKKIIDDFMLFGNETGLVDANINLEKYMKLLSKSRGFLMWQKAIALGKNYLEYYNFYMRQLFTDSSLTI